MDVNNYPVKNDGSPNLVIAVSRERSGQFENHQNLN